MRFVSPKFGCWGGVSEQMTRALVEWYFWWTLLKATSYKGYKLSVQSKGSCSSSQGTVCGAHAPHFEKMKLKYWKSSESSNKLPCPLHSITVPHLRENIYQTHQLPPAVPLLHQKFYYIAQEWHSAKVPKTIVWRHQRWLITSLWLHFPKLVRLVQDAMGRLLHRWSFLCWAWKDETA